MALRGSWANHNHTGNSTNATGGRSNSTGTRLVNQLAASRSPYVRSHSKNPTAWQMWSPESLALARKENKLIFLSIGYSACHWCHVMERESFMNEDVAKLLNENFIPIKVDREERPDIDRIYMNYVHATTGSGGWPLNIFLTADLEPVFGGTYWPGPNAIDGPAMKDQICFVEILEKIAKVWKEQQERCLQSAREIVEQLKEFTDEGLKGSNDVDGDSVEILEIDLLEEAYQHFLGRYDKVNGGFGIAPKFPTPVHMAFLLRLGAFPSTVEDIVGDMECENAKVMALTTLKNMSDGGIHDHVGHGFARYSVTPDWSLPHFEKMLYDNAQLLSVYLDGYLVSNDQQMLSTAFDIADYLVNDALLDRRGGGFFSAEDADSLYRSTDTEKREGAFYVWDRKEFSKILGEQDAEICAKYWNVRENGNVEPSRDAHDEFIHQNVLAVVHTPAELSQMFGISEVNISNKIRNARERLREHRDKERPRPNMDDKIVTGWNGLAIGALARLGSAVEFTDPQKSQSYIRHAERAATFLRRNSFNEASGRLKRIYREGSGETPGFADDYAYLIHGLLCLYEATFDASWLRWAHNLQVEQIELFWDSNQGGFFSTEAGAPDLILRLKEGMDSAEPSTNGVSANNLYRLGKITGDDGFLRKASQTCAAFSTEMLQHPFLFSSMLSSVVATNLGASSVVLAGRRTDPELNGFLRRLRGRLLTNTTIIFLDPSEQTDDARWLASKNGILQDAIKVASRKPSIQICQGLSCTDATDPEQLESAFDELG